MLKGGDAKANPSQEEPNEEHRPPTEAEIEQMMREQGIERFDFDAAFGEGADLVTDEELEEFLEWRRKEREAVREALNKLYNS